jgi:quinol-cytochrome oxidoreductase complex cytochrome b subunit
MWHIVLLPIGVVLIAALHVLLVRRRGIVPPFAQDGDGDGDGDENRPPTSEAEAPA